MNREPTCYLCPGVRLKSLGRPDEYRCPKCSQLYDFSDDTRATHNNPAIAAEINERVLPRGGGRTQAVNQRRRFS